MDARPRALPWRGVPADRRAARARQRTDGEGRGGDRHARAQRGGRARPHRAARRRRAARAPAAPDGGAAAGRGARRARRGTGGGEGHAAGHRELDRRPQRGGVMELRRPRDDDVDGLLAFFERIPAAERTFFKEAVLDRAAVESWGTGGGRRALACDDGEGIGYIAVVPLGGWADHVGEIRLVVDPRRRGPGGGGALPPRGPLQASDWGPAQPHGGGGAGASGGRSPAGRCCRRSTAAWPSSTSRSWPSRRARWPCSPRSASRPRACCATTSATAMVSFETSCFWRIRSMTSGRRWPARGS